MIFDGSVDCDIAVKSLITANTHSNGLHIHTSCCSLHMYCLCWIPAFRLLCNTAPFCLFDPSLMIPARTAILWFRPDQSFSICLRLQSPCSEMILHLEFCPAMLRIESKYRPSCDWLLCSINARPYELLCIDIVSSLVDLSFPVNLR